MAKRDSDELSRRKFLGISIGAAVVAGIGCGTEGDGGTSGAGGTTGVGGATGNGGASTTGGASSGTGGVTTSNGGTNNVGGATSAAGGETGTSETPAKGGGTATGNGGSSAGGTSAKGSGGTSSGGTTTKGTGGTTSTGTGTGTGTAPIVAMARDTDIATATMTAIAKIGLPDLTGKVVVIRPNQIEGKPDGTTNPEVIRGIIKAVKAASTGTVKQIIVAEDAFGGTASTTHMQTNGVTTVCTAEGATTLNLAGSATTNYKPTNAAAWPSGIDFYDTVYKADFVINAPRCKTHTLGNFSLALKAWFGSIKRPDGNTLHSSIMDKCAETRLVKKEDFVVLDASRCMVNGGPTAGGTMKDSNLVVASKDAIAADVTGLAIIRYFGGTSALAAVRNTLPWDQKQITRAIALKIPGWLSSAQDFTYWASTNITEAADIMAKRTA